MEGPLLLPTELMRIRKAEVTESEDPVTGSLGKPGGDDVVPATNAFPLPSRAMPAEESVGLEKRTVEPSELSLATKSDPDH